MWVCFHLDVEAVSFVRNAMENFLLRLERTMSSAGELIHDAMLPVTSAFLSSCLKWTGSSGDFILHPLAASLPNRGWVYVFRMGGISYTSITVKLFFPRTFSQKSWQLETIIMPNFV